MKKKIKELTIRETKKLIQEFERISKADNIATPPAPTNEFEKIIAEMKKRKIIPRIRKELGNDTE